MNLSNERAVRVKDIQAEINSPKHRLIHLCREMESVSPRHAKALEKIIGKLEQWQHRKP